jgi:aryl-alcohol dehydrogenase-like predicted oxidoreductase
VLYRSVPSTDLRVSEIALGTMQFGWTANPIEAMSVLDLFVASGGNLIDTADNYSRWVGGNPGGVSEQIIGRWLASRGKREDVVIITKVGKRMWDGESGAGLGREHILKACDASLRRLGTDYIDVYLCHLDDPETPLAETLSVLGELIARGKVRYVGCSNFSPSRLSEALGVSAANGLPRFMVSETLYNVLRRSEVDGIRTILSEHSVGLIAYNTLAAGFLTGKYLRDGPPVRSERECQVKRRYCRGSDYLALDAIRHASREWGLTVCQLALQWVLQDAAVTSAIVGVNSRTQLSEALGAWHRALSQEDWSVFTAELSRGDTGQPN